MHRTRLDIIADILNIAREGARKTRIMYQANLSYKLLKRYLAEVMGASLVLFNEKERRYLLTPKGNEFLRVYKEYSKRNKHVEKQLGDLQGKAEKLKQLCTTGQGRERN